VFSRALAYRDPREFDVSLLPHECVIHSGAGVHRDHGVIVSVPSVWFMVFVSRCMCLCMCVCVCVCVYVCVCVCVCKSMCACVYVCV
jgi:hypothetical protein